MCARRLGLTRLDRRPLDAARVSRLELGQPDLLRVLARVVDRVPALLRRRRAGGAESVLVHAGDDPRAVALVVRIVRRDQPPDDQVVQPPLVGVERLQVRPAVGRHDGVVVADAGIVVVAPGGQVQVHLRRGDQRGVRLGQQGEHLADLRAHVVGQIAAVRARIGDQLVRLIQRLRQLERPVGGKAKLLVGFALQRRQVEQLRRLEPLVLRPALLDHRRPALHRVAHALGGRAVVGARVRQAALAGLLPALVRPGLRLVRGARVRVDPKPFVVAEVCAHFPVLLGHKRLDFAVAAHDQAQRRRLHAADGQVRIVAQRERTRGVHADQPVGFAAAARGLVQRVVFGRRPEVGEALPDGLVGHRRDPQPLDRLCALRHLIDVAEDQLALARAVRRADDRADPRAVHQLAHDLKLRARVRQHLERYALRQHRQVGHAPLAVALVHLARLAQRDEVPDRPCDHIFLPVEIPLSARLRAQHPGDVPPNRRLFRHNQLLHAAPPRVNR